MIANYHSHTRRCNHATGTEREYLQAARDRGIREFGFSDHSPYPFPWYNVSWFRMGVDQLGEYTDTITKLRPEFPDMQIRIGLEAEYYPSYFRDLLSILKDSQVEYLLLGQHYLDNEIGAHYSGNATANEEHLWKYCHQTRDAMQTGLFTYFAHPDLIHFLGSEKVYEQAIRELCREANSCCIPLELNLLGIEKGRHYPNKAFWRIAAEENCSVIIGCDSHDPVSLTKTSSEETAMELIGELGLNLQHQVTLKPIR